MLLLQYHRFGLDLRLLLWRRSADLRTGKGDNLVNRQIQIDYCSDASVCDGDDGVWCFGLDFCPSMVSTPDSPPTLQWSGLPRSLDVPATNWLLLTVAAFVTLLLIREIWIESSTGCTYLSGLHLLHCHSLAGETLARIFSDHFKTILSDEVGTLLDTRTESHEAVCVL